jgi:hypothetical protein
MNALVAMHYAVNSISLLVIALWHSIAELNTISDDPPIPSAFVESPTRYRFVTLGNIIPGLFERVIEGDG